MSLLDRTGRCEQALGRFRAAELVHRKLLEQRTEVFGKKHTDRQRERGGTGTEQPGQVRRGGEDASQGASVKVRKSMRRSLVAATLRRSIT